MKKILLVLIAITLIISGCEKYEYNSTMKKICGGYTLKTYTVNGMDSLSSYKDSLGTDFIFYYDETEDGYYHRIEGDRPDGKQVYVGSKWGLYNNRNVLGIYESNGYIGIGPFGRGKVSNWVILNLTKEELKMKSNYNGKEYMIELE